MAETSEHAAISKLELRRARSFYLIAALGLFSLILIWDRGGVRSQTVFAKDSSPVAGASLIAEASRKSAPDFSLTDLEGTSLSLSRFRGRVVLLDFWGTTCGGCKIELPWYVEFDREFGSHGLSLVGLDMYGENPSVVRTFMKTWRMDYPVAIGTDRIGDEFHVQELPMTLLIDRQGRIAASHVGIVDRNAFRADIEALLKEN